MRRHPLRKQPGGARSPPEGLCRRRGWDIALGVAEVKGEINVSGQEPRKVLLAHAGRSVYRIALREQPSPGIRFATGEFCRIFKRATGVALAVEEGVAGNASPGIRIGNVREDTALAEALGPELTERITTEDHFLAREDWFCIRTSGQDLVIAGSGDRGACYGVYEVLERFLDCGLGMRDFEAEYVSETVPRLDRVVIPANLQIVQGPGFPLRTMTTHWGPRGANAALWALRQRCNVIELFPDQMPASLAGTGLLVGQGHHHFFYKTILRYGARELRRDPGFADRDAMRRQGTDGNHVPGFCFASESTAALFAAGCRGYLSEHPATKIVQITLPDGGLYGYPERDDLPDSIPAPRPCHCSACRRELDRIGRARSAGSYEDWGGFVTRFRNRVIESVCAEFPVVHFVSLAYTNYSADPAGIRPHPNTLVWYTIHQWDRLHNDRERTARRAEERLRQWVDAVDDSRQVMIWNARARRRALTGIRSVFDEEAPLYLRHGLGGGSVRPGMPYSYVRARMLWNPEADPQAMLDDYARRHYHEAAPAMRRVLELLRTEPWRENGQKDEAIAEIRSLIEKGRASASSDADALRNVQTDLDLLEETGLVSSRPMDEV